MGMRASPLPRRWASWGGREQRPANTPPRPLPGPRAWGLQTRQGGLVSGRVVSARVEVGVAAAVSACSGVLHLVVPAGVGSGGVVPVEAVVRVSAVVFACGGGGVAVGFFSAAEE